MACYKPMIRAEDTHKWVKALDGHLYHPAKIFSSDRLEDYDFSPSLGKYKYTPIPCGQCIGCRLDYSREWANRGYLELLMQPNAWFVTLTYDQDHIVIPDQIMTSDDITYTELEENDWKGILVPEDYKKFIKDLRQHFARQYKHIGIRFICCGEYGTENARPHMHFILYNVPFPIESFYNPRISWNKDIYYQNHILEELWDKGISNICEANWNNIAYTARYITKKQKGKESEDYYAEKGQIPEYLRASNHPGIGRAYYDKYKNEIYKRDQILIQNKEGSHWVKPPHYFDKLYEKENPDHFEEIKKQRQRDTINSLIIKGKTTSLTRWEQLEIEQSLKETQSSTLKRNNLERSNYEKKVNATKEGSQNLHAVSNQD